MHLIIYLPFPSLGKSAQVLSPLDNIQCQRNCKTVLSVIKTLHKNSNLNTGQIGSSTNFYVNLWLDHTLHLKLYYNLLNPYNPFPSVDFSLLLCYKTPLFIKDDVLNRLHKRLLLNQNRDYYDKLF